MLTDHHRGLSKVVSWCGDTTAGVETQRLVGTEIQQILLSHCWRSFLPSIFAHCRNMPLVLQAVLLLR